MLLEDLPQNQAGWTQMSTLLHERADAGDRIATSCPEDRRLVSRLLHRVTGGGPGRPLPRLNDVDPWLIGEDWANCVIVTVRQPHAQSVFTVIGDKLLPKGTTLLHEPISKCPASTLLGIILPYFAQALDMRACLMLEGAADHFDRPIVYRSLLLPLSEDNKKIDAVLIAANFGDVRKGEEKSVTTKLVWSHSFG
jgi:hypothetical protein